MALTAKTKGVAYVIVDDGQVLDWKVLHFRGKLRRGRILEYLLQLINLGDVGQVLLPKMVVQDRTEATDFLSEIRMHLSARNTPVIEIASDAVKASLGNRPRFNIAEELAASIPELRGSLPRRKKLWEAEHPNMLLFDAASLLVASGEL